MQTIVNKNETKVRLCPISLFRKMKTFQECQTHGRSNFWNTISRIPLRDTTTMSRHLTYKIVTLNCQRQELFS